MLSGEGMLRRRTVKNNNGSLAWFSYVGKIPIGDFTASRLFPINIPDRLEWAETNLESRELFYFPDASQISAMVGDHSRQMKTQICIVGDVGDGFRSLTTHQIAGLQSPHHASFNFWRTFHFRPNSSGESERELWRL